jgi:hypothetical protein
MREIGDAVGLKSLERPHHRPAGAELTCAETRARRVRWRS